MTMRTDCVPLSAGPKWTFYPRVIPKWTLHLDVISIMNELLKPSQSCLDLVKESEGLRLFPYKDAKGKLTIGYGHLIKPGEHFEEITEEEAEELLKRDLASAETAVKDLVQVELSQNQFDALTCFLFNVSPNIFDGSRTLAMLNAGNYEAVSERLPLYNGVVVMRKDGTTYKRVLPGLVKRRAREVELWERADS